MLSLLGHLLLPGGGEEYGADAQTYVVAVLASVGRADEGLAVLVLHLVTVCHERCPSMYGTHHIALQLEVLHRLRSDLGRAFLYALGEVGVHDADAECGTGELTTIACLLILAVLHVDEHGGIVESWADGGLFLTEVAVYHAYGWHLLGNAVLQGENDLSERT